MSFANQPEINPYAAPKTQPAPFMEVAGQPFVGYAGFWRRVGAYILDAILVQIFTFAAGFAVGILLEIVVAVATGNKDLVQEVAGRLMALVGIFINIAYYAGLESSSSQATLGKQALGIKVTDLEGRRISFRRAVGRLFGKILSALILGIGFLMVAFTEKKQGLHDMLAGTLVVKAR
jgi:uncharacterized RDD family membrane protein YckC